MCQSYFDPIIRNIKRLQNKRAMELIKQFFEKITNISSSDFDHFALAEHIQKISKNLFSEILAGEDKFVLENTAVIICIDLRNHLEESIDKKKETYKKILEIINNSPQ
jgi:hypothetical protein